MTHVGFGQLKSDTREFVLITKTRGILNIHYTPYFALTYVICFQENWPQIQILFTGFLSFPVGLLFGGRGTPLLL